MHYALPPLISLGHSTPAVLAPWVADRYPSGTYTLTVWLQNHKGNQSVSCVWHTASSRWHLPVQGLASMGEAGKDTPTRYELLAVAAGDLLPTTLATGRVVAQLALQATTGPVDARTMNERILDAVLATLEKTASKEQQRYVVDGRELERWPLAELERLASRYRSLVAQEAALAQGVLPFTVYKVGLA